MSDKERLIEIIQNSVGGCARHWAEIIADGLIEHGVIVSPCKVEDRVYRITKSLHTKREYIEVSKVSRIAVDNDGLFVFCECKPNAKCIFGKTVFLTKEEAEKKLKECDGE